MPLRLLGTVASSVQKISGSFESIATVTGNGSSLTLTLSSIPQTYTHLQVRFFIFNNTGGTNAPYLTINNDTGLNYAEHRLSGSGSIVSAGTGTTGGGGIDMFPYYPGTSPTYPTAGVIDILDYRNTSKYKTVRALFGCDLNGSGGIDLKSGLWMSTSAINRLDFITYSGYAFTSNTSIALYGIKGAS